jgi:hypothetical protein
MRYWRLCVAGLLFGLTICVLLPLAGCSHKEPSPDAAKQPAAAKEGAAPTVALNVIPLKEFEQTIQKQQKIVVMDVWAMW